MTELEFKWVFKLAVQNWLCDQELTQDYVDSGNTLQDTALRYHTMRGNLQMTYKIKRVLKKTQTRVI